MTDEAPAAIALVTSPEYLIPPSEMIGTSALAAAAAHSATAVGWGTPAPAPIRVVQMEPGPTPTLIASAPASIRSRTASCVATLPASMSVSGKRPFNTRTVSSTAWLWPCAVSTTTTSAPALTSSATRSSASSPTPTAAPTRRHPCSSLHASGYWIRLAMSLIVIRPLSSKRSLTTRSFSIRCWCRISRALSSVVPSGAVIRFSRVMTWEILRSMRVSKRRSRLVTMPTSLPLLVTGMPEIRYSSMILCASRIVWSGEIVTGFRIMPLSDFLTLSTSAAWSAAESTRWMIPMPPSRAIAMASRASVTVSMAALMTGMLIVMRRDNCVRVSVSAGTTEDLAGTNATSSKVSPTGKEGSSMPLWFRRRQEMRARRFLLDRLLLLQRGGLGLGHFGLLAQLQLPFVGRHELLHPEIGAVKHEDRAAPVHREAIGKVKLPPCAAETAPLRFEVPVPIELLDSVVAGVRHIHETVPIDGDPPRIPELAGLLPLGAPLHEKLRKEVRAGVELLDPMVAHVHDVHRSVVFVHRDAAGEIQLAVRVAEAAPGHDVLAAAVELLDAEIGAVHDVDVAPGVIDRHAPRGVELPLAPSLPPPLGEVAAHLGLEPLAPMVVGVADVDDPFLVHRNAGGIVEVRGRGAKHAPEVDEIPRVVEFLDPAVAGVHDVHVAVLVARQAERGRAEFPAVQEMGAAAGLPPDVHADIAGRVEQDGVGRRGGNVPAPVFEPDIDGLFAVAWREGVGCRGAELADRLHVDPPWRRRRRRAGRFRDEVARDPRIHVVGRDRQDHVGEVRHDRPVVDDHVGVLRRGQVDHRRRRLDDRRRRALRALRADRRQHEIVGGAVGQPAVGVRRSHAFDAGPCLWRHARFGVVVEVVGGRARHVHPAEGHFGVSFLGDQVGGRPQFRRTLFRRHLRGGLGALDRRELQDAGVAAIHDIDEAFPVDRDPVREVHLAHGVAAVAPLADEGAMAR